jgi:hypothetical protein
MIGIRFIRKKFEVFDLGFRLEDVAGLEDEPHSDGGSEQARAANLRDNGATEEEIRFLLKRRVELNAMTSDQLVAFLERKLTEHGVKKIGQTMRALLRLMRWRCATLRPKKSSDGS